MTRCNLLQLQSDSPFSLKQYSSLPFKAAAGVSVQRCPAIQLLQWSCFVTSDILGACDDANIHANYTDALRHIMQVARFFNFAHVVQLITKTQRLPEAVVHCAAEGFRAVCPGCSRCPYRPPHLAQLGSA